MSDSPSLTSEDRKRLEEADMKLREIVGALELICSPVPPEDFAIVIAALFQAADRKISSIREADIRMSIRRFALKTFRETAYSSECRAGNIAGSLEFADRDESESVQ
jgi:hypothetical protein